MQTQNLTQCFKTKSEIIERKLPKINGNNQYRSKTIIAIDGGYSSVKGVSPNKIFMFPSYAKRAPEGLEVIGKMKADDLQFRNDETGEVWVIGRTAEGLMDQTDIDSTTDASLFTRYRYDSPVFKAIMSTGIALGLSGTGKADDIYLQTGLPATYKERDQNKLVKALAGHYEISIKVGNNPWWPFVFDLPETNINVMEQPQGTLCACVYNNGDVSDLGKNILQSKGTCILDIGFGTEDTFLAKNGFKINDKKKTYSDTAMKSVFERVLSQVHNDYEESFKVFELQSFLETGKISYFDQETFSTQEIDFSDYLEKANKELCEKSIRRLMQDNDNLIGYKYLIVTGGTGESRFEQIKDMLSGIHNLTILPGNINTPDLSFAYSNVMGYYMYRYAQFNAEMKKLMQTKG